ncbi:tyrosine-type recombinase/integrase [Actinoallomurus sp. NPDC052274]|uniref:tyrosine-type recombinase/integrase n=1 Tax=Actinoallomurus sp. NPDC052274 TaxID=3155420 RepID=UPI003432C728
MAHTPPGSVAPPIKTQSVSSATWSCSTTALVQSATKGGGGVRTPRRGLLRRDYYNKPIWKPAVKAVGLPEDTTFHDLRHTFAGTAPEGVPISEVSRRLGHKSITTTVDLYGHLVPGPVTRSTRRSSSRSMCPRSALTGGA